MQIRICEGFSIAAIPSTWHSLLVGLVFEVRLEDEKVALTDLQNSRMPDAGGPRKDILGVEHCDVGFYVVRGSHLLEVLVASCEAEPGLDELLGWLVQKTGIYEDGLVFVRKSHAQEVTGLPLTVEVQL